jgi:hypothetical protein
VRGGRRASTGLAGSDGARGRRLLSRERVRNYSAILLAGSVLALAVSAVARTVSPGTAGMLLPDFLAHWTGGRMLVEGNASALYDPQVQQALQSSLGARTGDLAWFVSPPFVAAAYVPFAVLPYPVAAAAWTVASLGLLWAALSRLRSFGPGLWASERRLVLLAVAASYPVFELVGGGQDSAVSLAVWVAGILLAVAGRDVPAGIVFSLGLMKPQLVVLVPVVFALQHRVRGLLTFGAGGALFALASLSVAGPAGVEAWLRALGSPLYTEHVIVGQAWKAATLPALTTSLVAPAGPDVAAAAGYLVAAVLAGSFVLWAVRTRPDRLRLWVAALATTVAASPHLMLYDAVLLVPVAVFALDRLGTDRVRWAVAAAFCLAWAMPSLHSLAGGHGWPISVVAAPWVAVPVSLLWWRVMVQPERRQQ